MTTICGNPEAPVVLIQMVDDHDLAGMASEVAEIRRLTDVDFCLKAVKVQNWNADLSPWPAPPVFGRDGFGSGAGATLDALLEQCADDRRRYILGGYSLAGLFALWAGCRTRVFSGVAAASPSVWFPGFVDYMRQNPVNASSVYLSLGDREARTRNATMAAVGDRIREVHDLLAGQGIRTVLEWNRGNHFQDADIRTAKAFAWVMRGMTVAQERAPTE